MDKEDLLNLLQESWTLLAKQNEKKKYDLIIGISANIDEVKPLATNLKFQDLASLVNQLSFLMVFCEARGVFEATLNLTNTETATKAYLQAMERGFARVEKEIDAMNGKPH